MTQGFNRDLPRQQCTLKRAHKAHSWWSRKSSLYFQCSGSYGNGRTVSVVTR